MREQVRQRVFPDTVSEEALTTLLQAAKGVILNRLYPFDHAERCVVPSAYALLQCEIAVELWAKRGAEGQTSHTENGISRGWESAGVSSCLLRRITPMVGSVRTDA